MGRACLSLVLLGVMAGGCNLGQLKTPPTPEFKHQHNAAYAAQVKLLNPEELRIAGGSQTANDTTHTYLEVLVHNPRNQPEYLDALEPQLKKLAHLLVIDLKNPHDFEAVSIRVQTDHDYILAQTTNARTFYYPVDSLR